MDYNFTSLDEAKRYVTGLRLSVQKTLKTLASVFDIVKSDPPSDIPPESKATIEDKLAKAESVLARFDLCLEAVRNLSDPLATSTTAAGDEFSANASSEMDVVNKWIIIVNKATRDATNLFQQSSQQDNTVQLYRPIARAPPVLEADVDIRSFDEWRGSYLTYTKITGVLDRPCNHQISMLWTFLSPEMLSIIRDVFVIPEDTDLTVDEVLDSVRSHLRSRRSINVDWYELLTCKQHSHERVSSFLARLRRQAKYIGELNFDTLIQACLILGIRDNDARSKVLSSSPVRDLKETLELLQAIESTQEDLKLIHTEDPCYVDAINKQKPTSRALNQFQDQDPTPQLSTCPNCGYYQSREHSCPASSRNCAYCHTPGHFASVCRKSKRRNSSNNTGKYSQNFPSLATIADESSGHSVCSIETLVDVLIPVKAGKRKKRMRKSGTLSLIPDTGADITLITLTDANRLGIIPHPTSKRISSADGSTINCVGSSKVTLSRGEFRFSGPIFISKSTPRNYLSLGACKALHFVPETFPNAVATISTDRDIDKRLTNLIQDFKDVFGGEDELRPMQGPGVGEPMAITLKPGYIPYNLTVARPVPFAFVEARLVSLKILEPLGDRTTECCHAMVVLPKKMERSVFAQI